MKTTLAWLRTHLDTDAPLAAIIERLIMLGRRSRTLHRCFGRLGRAPSERRPAQALRRRYR
jgi:hypothetical protein